MSHQIRSKLLMKGGEKKGRFWLPDGGKKKEGTTCAQRRFRRGKKPRSFEGGGRRKRGKTPKGKDQPLSSQIAICSKRKNLGLRGREKKGRKR